MSADREDHQADNWNPCIRRQPHEAHDWRGSQVWHCPGVLAQWEQELVRTTSDMADRLAKAAERRGYEKAITAAGDEARYATWVEALSPEEIDSMAEPDVTYRVPYIATAFLKSIAGEVLGG